MKNRICSSAVWFILLITGTTSFGQNVASPVSSPATEGVRDPQRICPTVSVSCPNDPDVSRPFEFTATISGGDPRVTPTYIWDVFAGVIAGGQGTSRIRVNFVGRPGQTVTATLRVEGFDTVCSKTASCSFSNCLRPQPSRFDSYGIFPISKEQSRLELFAAALKQHRSSKGYILGYGGRRSRVGDVPKALDRARDYLANKLSIGADRLVIVDVGFKSQPTVDLWLVLAGGTPPPAVQQLFEPR